MPDTTMRMVRLECGCRLINDDESMTGALVSCSAGATCATAITFATAHRIGAADRPITFIYPDDERWTEPLDADEFDLTCGCKVRNVPMPAGDRAHSYIECDAGPECENVLMARALGKHPGVRIVTNPGRNRR